MATKAPQIIYSRITLPDGSSTEIAVHADGTDAVLPGLSITPDEEVLTRFQSRLTFHANGLPHPDDAPEKYGDAGEDSTRDERMVA